MRLLHKDFKFVFEFRENERNLLIVENPKIFSNFIKELYQKDAEDASGFVLSEAETPISIRDNLCCIVNPLAVSLNERRLLGRLYDKLKKEIMSSELLLENNKVLASLEKYAVLILQNSDFELTYSNIIDVSSILKLLDIRFEDRQETLLDKLVGYIEVMHNLMGVRLFVFVHLLSYLSAYEMEKLYEYLQYQKIYSLLVESCQPENIDWYSRVVIIDKDICEISLNM